MNVLGEEIESFAIQRTLDANFPDARSRLRNSSAPTQVSSFRRGGDSERYAHISLVLKRFDYPRLNKCERGLPHPYPQHTSGCSQAQIRLKSCNSSFYKVNRSDWQTGRGFELGLLMTVLPDNSYSNTYGR